MPKIKEEVVKGFTCSCGKFNRYELYVYAHWRDPLKFTCECGRRYSIVCGFADLHFTPKRLHVLKKQGG